VQLLTEHLDNTGELLAEHIDGAGQRCSHRRRRPGPADPWSHVLAAREGGAGIGWDWGQRWLGSHRRDEGGGWQTCRRRRSMDRVRRRRKMETGKIRDFANRPSSFVEIRYLFLNFRFSLFSVYYCHVNPTGGPHLPECWLTC
jgi:hypothetical protein